MTGSPMARPAGLAVGPGDGRPLGGVVELLVQQRELGLDLRSGSSSSSSAPCSIYRLTVQGHLMPRERVAPQSEVIRAI